MKLLRAAFLLLVLVNLWFFAWGRGYFGDVEEAREPKRLTSQLSPEKLRVVSAVKPSVAPQACRMLSGLSPEEALRLKTQAGEKAPGLELVVKPGQESPAASTYWVLIPPLLNRQAAEKRLLELKRLGLSDATLMQEEGPGRFAISLGLFSSEQAAQERLKDLVKRGVKSAQVQARKRPMQWLARGPAELLAKSLPELLSAFPAASIADCPVDH